MEQEHFVQTLRLIQSYGIMVRFRGLLLCYGLWKCLCVFCHFFPCMTPLTLCFYPSRVKEASSFLKCLFRPSLERPQYPYLPSSFLIHSSFFYPHKYPQQDFASSSRKCSSFTFSCPHCDLEFSLHPCIPFQFSLSTSLFQSLF